MQELDEDDREVLTDFTKHGKFKVKSELDLSKVAKDSTVLICSSAASKAVTRILYQDNWTEIGVVSALHEEKTKEILKGYVCDKVLVLFPTSEMDGMFCGDTIDLLWPTFEGCSQMISLQTVYKTQYSTFEGSHQIEDSQFPFKFMRSSHCGSKFDGFLGLKSHEIS